MIDQPYRARHLCADHLRRSVEERFQRELRRQWPRPGGVVAVALSGGKDSAVALALTHRYLAGRPGATVVALSVDEGIAGYRPATLQAAAALTASLGVEHRIVRAETEIGTTTDRTATRLRGTPPCSYCGVWRRRLLNRAARDAGARALVLGFNLDDLAQTALMNAVAGDVDRLVRMAPHRAERPGFVPRLAPLAQVPEREVYLYARLERLPFDHGTCPHAARAARNRFREIVWELESARPGTRQSLLRLQERVADLAGSTSPPLQPCRACGESATGPLCRSCELLRLAETVPEAA